MTSTTKWSVDDLQKIIKRYWGFDSIRPLQGQAMTAVLEGRDSVVVLPTGGGKSLCYQAPATLREEMTVVVSPLISLMKDQVDGLKACGVPAERLDSTQGADERNAAEAAIRRGEVRLVFVSPERLANLDFQRMLQEVGVRTFAIDEAHCISHWGHDFRKEYRQLKQLKTLFEGSSIHAYTATATEFVRNDIIRELGLNNPEVLVGNFDRPNLTYRVVFRRDVVQQTLEVIQRHSGEAGVIYCIRRKEVDELAAALRKKGLNAVAYHAGLTADDRRKAQDAFANEKCDLIVATVAFGMGIDRSNVRFVMHTGMPKSIEHYQQETGRAGRDGLDAECVLLFSNGDLFTWKSIMEKAATEDSDSETASGNLETSTKQLSEMSRYCRSAICRHRSLVQYFGQSYDGVVCEACDICLGETIEAQNGNTIAQKILSCVARIKKPFGMGHIVSVLRGEDTDNIKRWEHNQLSTFGILKEHDKAELRDWLDQLVGHGALERTEIVLRDGRGIPVVTINAESWAIMRGQKEIKLLQPMRGKKTKEKGRGGKTQPETASWEGVDRDLFEALRQLRREIAQQRRWQPYMVFGDNTLRELARVRPSSATNMMRIYGVGENKLKEFGEQFRAVIDEHSAERSLPRDKF